MNFDEIQERDRKRYEFYSNKLKAICDHLTGDWLIDNRVHQNNIYPSYKSMKSGPFTVAFDWGYSAGHKKIMASLRVKGVRCDKSIKFSVARKSHALAKDLENRLLSDLDQWMEKHQSALDEIAQKKACDESYQNRVGAYISFMGFSKCDRNRYQSSTKVSTENILVLDGNYQDPNRIDLSIGKNTNDVDIFLGNINESVAFKILGLIKEDSKKEQNNVR